MSISHVIEQPEQGAGVRLKSASLGLRVNSEPERRWGTRCWAPASHKREEKPQDWGKTGLDLKQHPESRLPGALTAAGFAAPPGRGGGAGRRGPAPGALRGAGAAPVWRARRSRDTDTASLRSARTARRSTASPGAPTGAIAGPSASSALGKWAWSHCLSVSSLEMGVQEADFQPAGMAPSKRRNLS